MNKKIIIFFSITILLVFLMFFMTIYDFKINNIKTDSKLNVELDKCVDGDTAWFKINGKSKKYRFLSVDSYELDTDYGIIAKDYVCDLLTNAKEIKIEYDIVGKIRDKYERELVWVYVDDELIQEKILSKGYARIKYVYANYKYLENLILIEDKAIKEKLGIWKNYYYKTYNDYYTITFDYTYMNKNVKVLKNNIVELIDNPFIEGCRFIGWKNGNYLFDLSTKIKKDYNLVAKFDC